jgi:hypothetical protein
VGEAAPDGGAEVGADRERAASPAPTDGVRRLEARVIAAGRPDPEPGERVPPRIEVAGDEGDEPVRLTLQPTHEGRWPEWGPCTFEGRVVDALGTPLIGATVYRFEPDAPESAPGVVAYSNLAEIATTGSDGRFRAPGQPARAVRLTAEFSQQRFRRRGLAVEDPVSAHADAGGTVRGIEIRLPIRERDLGRIVGRIVDDRGRPLRGVVAYADRKYAVSDAEGRFRVEAVRSGEVKILVDAAGYEAVERTARVRGGGEAEVELQLLPHDPGGLRLAGRVVDRDETPLPGVSVWVGSPDDAYRYARTDADGRFRIDRLGHAFAEGVSFGAQSATAGPGILASYLSDLRLPRDDLVIVARRAGWLHVVVEDAPTGDPVPVYDLLASRPVDRDDETKFEPYESLTVQDEHGVGRVITADGLVRLRLEAPGGRLIEVEVDVPDVERVNEVVVRLPRE